MVSKRSHGSNVLAQSAKDDFKLIRGVGLVTEAKLHKAGILSYVQLSLLSPQKIADAVHGLSVKRIVKEKWISQAYDLTKIKKASSHSKAMETSECHAQYAHFTVELLETGRAHRTRVVHVESGASDTWPYWDAKRLIDFFGQSTGVDLWEYKSNLKRHFEPQEHVSARPKKKTKPKGLVEVKFHPSLHTPPNITGVLQLRDLQVVAVNSNNPPFLLYENQPFIITLVLNFSKIVAPKNELINYIVTIISKKLGGASQILGEVSNFAMVPDEVIPRISGSGLEQGTYRLYASARIESETRITAFLLGDLLQVY